MQEKLDRKETLLRDYEIDLAKLRQAEFLLQKKAEQLDNSQIYSRNKDDEIEFLKESLKNAKAELERERLINAAVKQKKSISTVTSIADRVRRGSTDTLHHHCPPDDPKSSQMKRAFNDKLKRKDYELKALKSELKTKSDELSNLSSRYTITTSHHHNHSSSSPSSSSLRHNESKN